MTTEAFVEAFARAWALRDGSGFAELWLDDGVLVHPTLERPLRGCDVARWSERVKESLPDLRFQVDTWAARGDLVMLQWTSTATIGGRLVRWSGVDRLRLRGGKIAQEVVYFDTLEIWRAIDPSMARPPLVGA